jgi:hypothetical protein
MRSPVELAHDSAGRVSIRSNPRAWLQGVRALCTNAPRIPTVESELEIASKVGWKGRLLLSMLAVTARGPIRTGRSQGNLARTPDVAVVISLKQVFGPCG